MLLGSHAIHEKSIGMAAVLLGKSFWTRAVEDSLEAGKVELSLSMFRVASAANVGAHPRTLVDLKQVFLHESDVDKYWFLK